MDNKISTVELEILHQHCLEKLLKGKLYDLRNSTKIRSVKTAKSYEEFKNMVDAAHLNPICKVDKQKVQTKKLLWNNISS